MPPAPCHLHLSFSCLLATCRSHPAPLSPLSAALHPPLLGSDPKFLFFPWPTPLCWLGRILKLTATLSLRQGQRRATHWPADPLAGGELRNTALRRVQRVMPNLLPLKCLPQRFPGQQGGDSSFLMALPWSEGSIASVSSAPA